MERNKKIERIEKNMKADAHHLRLCEGSLLVRGADLCPLLATEVRQLPETMPDSASETFMVFCFIIILNIMSSQSYVLFVLLLL